MSINSLSISLLYNLKTGTHSKTKKGLFYNVVQKGNVGSTYVYALQHHAADNYVFRAKPQKNSTIVAFGDSIAWFKGDSAGGHTQTWEYAYANEDGNWFIGTKGKANGDFVWDTQIARVKIPGKPSYSSNTEVPRLSYLNRAGGFGLAGTDLLRSEAAVSSDHKYFLIALIDQLGNGYFSLYNLNEVNRALDIAGNSDVNIESLEPNQEFRPFKIQGITEEDKIGSIQGYDIDFDNNGKLNLYISSEKAPEKGKFVSKPRHIYKIPWGVSQKSGWDDIDLSHNSSIDYGNEPTELESIQVVGENHLYLTVGYHGYISKKKWGTVANRIFEVTWKNGTE